MSNYNNEELLEQALEIIRLEARVTDLEEMRQVIAKVTQDIHPDFAARLDEIYEITSTHAPKS